MANDLSFHSLEQVYARMENLSDRYNEDASVMVGCQLLSETFSAIAMIAREVEKLQQAHK